tara:strand:+ start:1836 stop:2249 length:414 start_codon:yes stop_codon:yes gene_type:complete
MKNNELSTAEKLDVAIQSHKFYNQQCVNLEKKINIKIDNIFQTEEAGKNISKKDISETVKLVGQLLSLSSKYMKEGFNVVSELEKATKEDIDEDFAEAMKTQLADLHEKQQSIHDRVTEIQNMLFEMYDIEEGDETF